MIWWYHIISICVYNFDRWFPMVNHAFSKVNRRTRCSIFHCKLSNDQRVTVFIIVFFQYLKHWTQLYSTDHLPKISCHFASKTPAIWAPALRLPRPSRDKCGRRAGPVGRFTEHLQLISCDRCESEQSFFSLVLNILDIIDILYTGGYKPGGYGFQQLKLQPNVMGSNN